MDNTNFSPLFTQQRKCYFWTRSSLAMKMNLLQELKSKKIIQDNLQYVNINEIYWRWKCFSMFGRIQKEFFIRNCWNLNKLSMFSTTREREKIIFRVKMLYDNLCLLVVNIMQELIRVRMESCSLYYIFYKTVISELPFVFLCAKLHVMLAVSINENIEKKILEYFTKLRLKLLFY